MRSLARSRYFRISVTDTCNMSCAFCHNEGQGQIRKGAVRGLDVASIVWIAHIAMEEGFRKFKLTGGEPLLRTDICDIVRGLREAGVEELSIITNGTLLDRLAVPLRRAGLGRVNVSLHSLDPFRLTSEFGGTAVQLRKVVDGIDAAMAAGFDDMKINFVYGGPHPDRDLGDILSFVAERGLTLVLLPELPFGAAVSSEFVSLERLHVLLKARGIEKENQIVDAEGLRKRLIVLRNGARVVLRVDELGERRPYAACGACRSLPACREGIFPVRLTAIGALRPCLNDGIPETPLTDAIRRRDAQIVREAMQNFAGF